MPKGYPKDGRKPGNAEALAKWRKSFAKGDRRASEAGEKGRGTQKALREFSEILTEQLQRESVKGGTLQEELAGALIRKSLKGDPQAYALLLKLIGQYPEEKLRATILEELPTIVDDIPAEPRETARDGAKGEKGRRPRVSEGARKGTGEEALEEPAAEEPSPKTRKAAKAKPSAGRTGKADKGGEAE